MAEDPAGDLQKRDIFVPEVLVRRMVKGGGEGK